MFSTKVNLADCTTTKRAGKEKRTHDTEYNHERNQADGGKEKRKKVKYKKQDSTCK